MNDLKNRQLFWLLKRFSSVTYWRRYMEAYAPFVEAYEFALKTCTPTAASWVTDFKDHLDTLIDFEKGIALLSRGERQVFVSGHPERFLARADFGAYAAWRLVNSDEYVLHWMSNYADARAKIVHAFETYGHPPVINNRQQPYWQQIRIKPGVGFSTPHFNFGTFPTVYPPDLPIVPASDDSVILRPGDRFPAYGIYQPYVEIPGKGFLFKSPLRWEEYGCMMYGLQDTEVPVSNKWENTPKPVIRNDVVWKLLWEDRRYEDGTIPEEEQSYFLDQSPARTPSSDAASKRCEPNQPCPRTGYWWTPANKDSRQYFAAGEIMPDYPHSKYGSTFWYREEGQ